MLTMDSVVKVNLTIGASVAVNNTFSVGAIIGSSSVLTKTDRFGTYANLDEVVAAGFTSSMPEYKAAEKYFGGSHVPEKLIIILFSKAENDTDTLTGALTDAISKGADFYGVYYCPGANDTAAQTKTDLVAIATFLESTYHRGALFYGVTGTVSSAIAADALFGTMAAISNPKEARRRAFGMYCKESADDAAGMMGLAMGYASERQYDAFALIYKPIEAATTCDLTQTEVNQIKNLNGNVYVQRTAAISCLEDGSSADGMRFDELLYLDRIAYDLQSSCFNLIATNESKLLQNDTTTELLISEINRVLEDYYNGGVLATQVWTGPTLGNVQNGATLEHGYAAFAESYDLQSDEDRAARKAMPITVLLTMSGAVETVELNLYVVE